MSKSRPKLLQMFAKVLQKSEEEILGLESGALGSFDKVCKVAEMKNVIKSYNISSGAEPISSNLSKSQLVPILKEILRGGTYVSGRHKSVYDALIHTPGIAREEVLEELEQIDESENIDYDTMIGRIISRREQGEVPQFLLEENEQYDAAALASEQERDRIQERKRRRIAELEKGLDMGLASAEEYAHSLFLGLSERAYLISGVKYVRVSSHSVDSEISVTCSSSSSSSSCNSRSRSRSIDSDIRGCRVIKFLVSLVDNLAWFRPSLVASMVEHMDGAMLPSDTDKQLETLCTLLCKILELEKNSVHWYSTASIPYIFKLSSMLDEVCKDMFQSFKYPSGRMAETTSGKCCRSSDEIDILIAQQDPAALKFQIDLEVATGLLKKIVCRWEKRMFQISMGGAGGAVIGVPTLYTKALTEFAAWDQTPQISLAGDGIEIAAVTEKTRAGPFINSNSAESAASEIVSNYDVPTSVDWTHWSDSEPEVDTFDEADYYASD